ncbi:putative 14-3-3 protein [Helianthus annuus]|nr:putative 14-3-3 protein [Helianthus annuus]KAJ0882778.1 putative 14-3-3 protein [Helianthus annuus]
MFELGYEVPRAEYMVVDGVLRTAGGKKVYNVGSDELKKLAAAKGNVVKEVEPKIGEAPLPAGTIKIDGVNDELTVLSYDGLSPASDGNCIPQKSRSFWNNLLSLRSTEASREDNVYMAKLAEQAERYEEMVELMEKVVKIVDSEELTEGIMEVISSMEQKEESRGNENHVKLIKDYRATIETKLSKICDGILGLLGSHLIPSASSSEAKIFYLKMKGDYFRYLAEFKTGADRMEATEVGDFYSSC